MQENGSLKYKNEVDIINSFNTVDQFKDVIYKNFKQKYVDTNQINV